MEKIKLEYKTPKNKTFEWNDYVIEVKPYITIGEQAIIIFRYIYDYFNYSIRRTDEEKLISEAKYCYLEAEYTLYNSILDICTNVEVDEDFTMDILDSSDLMIEVKNRIKNYPEFKERLDRVVFDIKEQIALEKSIGTILDEISEKLYTTLNNFSEFTPEKMNEIVKITTNLSKEITSISSMGSIEKVSKKKKFKND